MVSGVVLRSILGNKCRATKWCICICIVELCMHCCISLEHGSLVNYIRRVLVTPFPLNLCGELFSRLIWMPIVKLKSCWDADLVILWQFPLNLLVSDEFRACFLGYELI